ncbi:hypothetical protein CsSME_00013162 [Camellia sinensis var. sinensis]
MVTSLKTGRLRKKTLTSTITDSPVAIPLGSTFALSPVVPVRSNVRPSHHATSPLLVDFDETTPIRNAVEWCRDFEAHTCMRTNTWQRNTKNN